MILDKEILIKMLIKYKTRIHKENLLRLCEMKLKVIYKLKQTILNCNHSIVIRMQKNLEKKK